MNCDMVRKRLVALSDNELAPSERDYVLHHLNSCDACLDLSFRLDAATPTTPKIQLAAHVRHRLHLNIDAAIDAAWTAPAAKRSSPWTGLRYIAAPSLLLAAATALFVLGWNANFLTDTSGGVAQLNVAPRAPSTVVPLDAYRPAAYTPEDGWF
ncbi:MAG: anti-sigma factor RsiW [Kiritimatiellia bacterium]|jgi:anti-sigma factor RsiW